MKRICAWCKKELPFVEGDESTEGISHGMCEICAENFGKELDDLDKENNDKLYGVNSERKGPSIKK